LGSYLLFQPLILCGVATVEGFGLLIEQLNQPTFFLQLISERIY
jgi:hypothetical protein